MITIWSNGFTINDSELRLFEENHEFLDNLMRGQVPSELRSFANVNFTTCHCDQG